MTINIFAFNCHYCNNHNLVSVRTLILIIDICGTYIDNVNIDVGFSIIRTQNVNNN